MVLNDFMRGKIPWFTPAPAAAAADEVEAPGGRKGRLGEMPRKRSQTEAMGAQEVSQETSSKHEAIARKKGSLDRSGSADDKNEFEGFGSDTEGPMSRRHSATTADFESGEQSDSDNVSEAGDRSQEDDESQDDLSGDEDGASASAEEGDADQDEEPSATGRPTKRRRA